ncbi:MAG: NADH-quinone oxidoreductase subunit J [Candidatus Omnitrophica bacterium]|nr:NADH-quinone oxidoreductase subunit J [Candidatus Omnitrophota bacterium]
MTIAFYVASAVALFATLMVVTRRNPVHAVLYLMVSLLAVAVVFFTLGAHFAAALEVIIYAGAIIVLFVFMIMLLNIGPPPSTRQESLLLTPGIWVGPSALSVLLAGLFLYVILAGGGSVQAGSYVDAKTVGISMFEIYFLGVELASMILLAGLVGAYHLGKRDLPDEAEGGNG